ncbi:MAG: hypothetical protein RIR11_1159 [Bacteroidota bacterium]|jgi:hypothetical protein
MPQTNLDSAFRLLKLSAPDPSCCRHRLVKSLGLESVKDLDGYTQILK